MSNETIKARVISAVRSDPFLSIDEIASKVETTPRYVRTILSEAKISLLQLRKEYAKKMEKQLHPTTKQTDNERRYQSGLEITKIRDPQIAKLLNQNSDSQLLQVSRMDKKRHILIYHEIITYLDLHLSGEDGSLRQLLSQGQNELDLVQGESWVEVVTDKSNLSKLLIGNENQPLLKVNFLLYQEELPVAVEIQWLPTEGIVLRDKTGNLEIAE